VIGLPLSTGVVIVDGGVAGRYGGVHDVTNHGHCWKPPSVTVEMTTVKRSIRAKNIRLLIASVHTAVSESLQSSQEVYDGGLKSLGTLPRLSSCLYAGSELYPPIAVEHLSCAIDHP